jgi:hypothetical protein
VFLVGVGIATTLIWPPVYEHLAEMNAGHAGPKWDGTLD